MAAMALFQNHQPTEFKSPRLRARIAMAGLGAVLLANLAQAALLAWNMVLLDRSHGGQIPSSDFDALVKLLDVADRLYKFAFYATAGAFILWFYRLYDNLSSFASTPLRYDASWTIASFFVPFINFVRPLEMMSEAWRHNAPAEKSASLGLVQAWWASFLVSRILPGVMNIWFTDFSTELSVLTRKLELGIFSVLLSVAAAVLAMLVVHRQTEYQIARTSKEDLAEVF